MNIPIIDSLTRDFSRALETILDEIEYRQALRTARRRRRGARRRHLAGSHLIPLRLAESEQEKTGAAN